jgi:hypothetical protein
MAISGRVIDQLFSGSLKKLAPLLCARDVMKSLHADEVRNLRALEEKFGEESFAWTRKTAGKNGHIEYVDHSEHRKELTIQRRWLRRLFSIPKSRKFQAEKKFLPRRGEVLALAWLHRHLIIGPCQEDLFLACKKYHCFGDCAACGKPCAYFIFVISLSR